jgi:threonine/homoserine/homoserine lactone efflux protein
MTIDTVVAFALFAFVSSITPGPNNLMLLASGMNFGFKAAVPHMLGISGGFFILLLAVGFGLGEVFARQPVTYTVMKWAGAIYLVYLAWRIANAGAVADPVEGAIKPKPLSFIGAALFQWVNPKAWVMAASTFSIYLPPTSSWLMAVAFSALFTAINLPCVSCWTLFG